MSERADCGSETDVNTETSLHLWICQENCVNDMALRLACLELIMSASFSWLILWLPSPEWSFSLILWLGSSVCSPLSVQRCYIYCDRCFKSYLREWTTSKQLRLSQAIHTAEQSATQYQTIQCSNAVWHQRSTHSTRHILHKLPYSWHKQSIDEVLFKINKLWVYSRTTHTTYDAIKTQVVSDERRNIPI
jgi:hypothetical protein